ncbi:hypothetical protein BC835DRAFT_1311453 [Cytidiella melzeri]|nr:hypothetical protein BC835DRAFT_1311453 [Cytidiella melzeri]
MYVFLLSLLLFQHTLKQWFCFAVDFSSLFPERKPPHIHEVGLRLSTSLAKGLKLVRTHLQCLICEIKGRTSQLCGEVVTLARATTPRSLLRRTVRSTVLTDRNAFIYKDPASREPGVLLCNQLLQDVLNQAFFCKTKDEGIVYSSCFKATEGDIPLPTIALIITAIDCAISQFRSRGAHLTGVYGEDVHEAIQKLLHHSRKLEEVQRDMYRLACIHAGVDENVDDTITSPKHSLGHAPCHRTP